jgi:hypothetical protein
VIVPDEGAPHRPPHPSTARPLQKPEEDLPSLCGHPASTASARVASIDYVPRRLWECLPSAVGQSRAARPRHPAVDTEAPARAQDRPRPPGGFKATSRSNLRPDLFIAVALAKAAGEANHEAVIALNLLAENPHQALRRWATPATCAPLSPHQACRADQATPRSRRLSRSTMCWYAAAVLADVAAASDRTPMFGRPSVPTPTHQASPAARALPQLGYRQVRSTDQAGFELIGVGHNTRYDGVCSGCPRPRRRY